LNLLITNDDGIGSNGIKALEKVLGKKHNTFLVAPLKERSATSQALSIIERLRVERVYDNHYVVDGYPVDCVNIGLHGGIFPPIDIVISGINRGVNMGDDVYYSGTVGAARHAVIHGTYGFALSSGKPREQHPDYLEEAEIFLEVLETKFSLFKKGIVYNINFPPSFPRDISKIQITKLGLRTVSDGYEVTTLYENISEYYLGGSTLSHLSSPGSDFDAYDENLISISPIKIDSTHYQELEELHAKF
jgi:5'-nucleotidase